MAAITPSTNLKLLKNINNLSSQNQLTFANATAQYNYFNSLPKIEVDGFTYQRKDYTIRYKACIDDILDYNYVMYQNSAYSNKWFYAYITNMRWLNDHLTEITIKTDVYQSFMFDITFKASFIEREHVNDDTVGLHTIPEGLETGEYVCNGITSLFGGGNSTYICIASTETPISIGTNPYIRKYNGVYSGVYYTLFNAPLSASNFIRALDANAKGDAVTSVFLVPTSITGTLTFTHYQASTQTPGQTIEFDAAVPPYSDGYTPMATSSDIISPTSLNGYTPKNNKLFTYPYNYFYITNNVGMDIDFHYEDFINNTAVFKTVGAITPGCSIKCYPINYKKLADTQTSVLDTMNSFNYGITAAKYPICSWDTDVYTNWLTGNGINIGGFTLNAAQAGYVKGVVGIGVGIGAAAISGDAMMAGNLIGGGVRNIFDTMQENYRHSLVPDSAKGNTNSGDITFSAGNMDIPLYKMSIRSEFATSIDNYLSMFGYKVNIVKVPNLTGRLNWNYVKCLGANIEGLIPEFYMDEIKSIFNSGVTLWHNPSTFLDYTQSNTIVS